MSLDALMLSRIQFAANISFHILFPTITIALCWFLLFFRVRLVQTRDPAWEEAYYFWTKVFALTFALGVVSGIVGLVGGLGGFLLPIMFGALVDLTGIRSSVFMLLWGVTTVSLVWMYWTEIVPRRQGRGPVGASPASHPAAA